MAKSLCTRPVRANRTAAATDDLDALISKMYDGMSAEIVADTAEWNALTDRWATQQA